MDREILGYLLLALMMAGMAAVVWFKLYHSRDRAYRRRTKREKAEHERAMAERADN